MYGLNGKLFKAIFSFDQFRIFVSFLRNVVCVVLAFVHHRLTVLERQVAFSESGAILYEWKQTKTSTI